jgi:uncharacterized protein YlxW (UPF0749 family)
VKLSKVLFVLAVLALLASNGFLVYQNNRTKTKVDKLQTEVTGLQKQVKGVDQNVLNTDSDVQQVCSSISNC